MRWLEEARVRYLTFCAIPYEDLVEIHDTELVVRDLSIRYVRAARMGDVLDVSVRQGENTKMRIEMVSEFVRVSDGVVCAKASVTLVPVIARTGKMRRSWPDVLEKALRGR